jgi:hypothetical protein
VWEFWESRSQGGQSQVYNIRKPRAAAGAGGFFFFAKRSTYGEGGRGITDSQLVRYQLDGCKAGFVSSRSLRLVGPHGSSKPPKPPRSNPR